MTHHTSNITHHASGIPVLLALMWVMAQGVWAEGTRVMRFLPVAGTESEVALNTLRKVVFTPDSVVLIAAKDGAQTPMYKYDYQAIVFSEKTPTDIDPIVNRQSSTRKVIKDGHLLILYNDRIYNAQGQIIK